MEAGEPDSLAYTPTWAVAAICAIFILCSLVVERSIFFIGQLLRNYNQTALSAALEKIKEELMVVGFTSLALGAGQRTIIHICVPVQLINFMPQCRRTVVLEGKASETMSEEMSFQKPPVCRKGTTPLIQMESLHQLHTLLYVLAVVHVIYSIIIMALGVWKVSQWRAWEGRAHAEDSLRAHGQRRFTRDVTFIRRHASGRLCKNWFLAYVVAFFQQFFCSVSETDYLTLRQGFVKKHMLIGFNFHKYILRTLEDDFKHVVGISPSLWGYMVLLTFLNVQGWGMYFWASFIPLIMVLAIGTKLRHIIIRMAVRCFEDNPVVQGLPDVKPTDELFWFRSPRLILYLIHYILFQDALELSLQLWTKFEFPNGICFYRHHFLLYGRLVLGALAQLICGYVMLPIYALVSQMGSEMKVRNEHLQMASLRWQEEGPHSTGRAADVETPERMLDATQEFDPMQLYIKGPDLENQDIEDTDPEDIEEENDQGSKVDDAPPIQRQGSFTQRVADSVHAADYDDTQRVADGVHAADYDTQRVADGVHAADYNILTSPTSS